METLTADDVPAWRMRAQGLPTTATAATPWRPYGRPRRCGPTTPRREEARDRAGLPCATGLVRRAADRQTRPCPVLGVCRHDRTLSLGLPLSLATSRGTQLESADRAMAPRGAPCRGETMPDPATDPTVMA